MSIYNYLLTVTNLLFVVLVCGLVLVVNKSMCNFMFAIDMCFYGACLRTTDES